MRGPYISACAIYPLPPCICVRYIQGANMFGIGWVKHTCLRAPCEHNLDVGLGLVALRSCVHYTSRKFFGAIHFELGSGPKGLNLTQNVAPKNFLRRVRHLFFGFFPPGGRFHGG